MGEEQLSEKIKNLEDKPLPPIGEISQVVAGKLLTGKPVYVEAKDLFKAICLISEVATIVKPIDYLEYTFVISRLSFVDADLLVGPNKPLNTEFDLNLDTEKILAAAGLEQKYKQIVKNSKNELILKKISNKEFKTKQDLATGITQESWKGLPGIEKMEWEKIASPLGLQISLSAKEAIDTVLITGNISYWNRYISSPTFNIQEFKAVILKEPWNNFERFIQLIRPSLLAAKDPPQNCNIRCPHGTDQWSPRMSRPNSWLIGRDKNRDQANTRQWKVPSRRKTLNNEGSTEDIPCNRDSCPHHRCRVSCDNVSFRRAGTW